MIRSLVVRAGEEPYVRVTRFVSDDADGAEQESWTETPDGTQLTEPERGRSTWLGFQEHASFPAATTEIAEEEIDIPAGRFACLKYTNRDADSESTFWFARSAPGMPLRYEQRVSGEVVFSSTAIENVPSASAGSQLQDEPKGGIDAL